MLWNKLIHKSFLLLIFFGATSEQLIGQQSVTLNADAQKAYNSILSLRFQEANGLLSKIKKENPENRIVDLLDNYIDFFTININEEKNEFRRLEKNKSIRLESAKQLNDADPYCRYIQAEILIQWALVRLKFGEYFTALRELSKANGLLEENEKLFPDFIANQTSLGMLQAMMGTIPDSYRSGLSWISGIDASIENGKARVQKVLSHAKNNDFFFEQEAVIMYAFLLLHLGNQGDDAWKSIQNNPKLQAQKSPMACFVLANIALKTGQNDKAIQILEQRPKSADFFPFPYLDFLLGIAKLQKLSPDANVYFNRYLQHSKSSNYIKEAYQKLAWYSWVIENKEENYWKNMWWCLQKGSDQLESDKSALKEAQSKLLPHKELLKIRLLFDGGYYQEALAKIKTVSNLHGKEKLEYHYRYGRICHKLFSWDDCLKNYKYCIENEQFKNTYIACNAALQLGQIFEEWSNFKEAKLYYNRCLGMKSDQYQSSLHQKAKAGLNRIAGKMK